MKCAEIQKQIPDYHAGLLDADPSIMIDAHLAMCQECASEADGLLFLFEHRERIRVPGETGVDWNTFSVEVNERIDDQSASRAGFLSYLVPVAVAVLFFVVLPGLPTTESDVLDGMSEELATAAEVLQAEDLIDAAYTSSLLRSGDAPAAGGADDEAYDLLSDQLQDEIHNVIFLDTSLEEVLAAGAGYLSASDVIDMAEPEQLTALFAQIDAEFSEI